MSNHYARKYAKYKGKYKAISGGADISEIKAKPCTEITKDTVCFRTYKKKSDGSVKSVDKAFALRSPYTCTVCDKNEMMIPLVYLFYKMDLDGNYKKQWNPNGLVLELTTIGEHFWNSLETAGFDKKKKRKRQAT